MTDNKHINKQWLPTTKKEIEHLGGLMHFNRTCT